MKMQMLKLENFQGIRELMLPLNGENVSIYGDNATGKTTVANAISWLLFDKASTGEKGFTPKTVGKHNLDHSVTASFANGAKNSVELKKVFKETYTKKRGRIESEFTGHTTDYYIDGVPSKKKEFDSAVEALFGTPEQMQVLFQPLYFAETLDWQKRRNILLDMCGDVQDADVLTAMGEEGKYLSSNLGDKNIEDYLKIVKAQKNDIASKIDSMPDRIDEAHRALPDIPDVGEENLVEAMFAIDMELENAHADLRELHNSGGDLVIKNRIAELKSELSTARAEHSAHQSRENEDANKKINEMRNALSELESRRQTLERHQYEREQEIEHLQLLRDKLIEEHTLVKSEKWQGSTVCPTCKQDLPADQIESAKDRFHIKRSERLEAINKRGQEECSQQVISNLVTENKTSKKHLDELGHEIQELQKSIDAAKKPLKETEEFEKTDIYKRIFDEIKGLEESGRAKFKEVTKHVAELEEKVETKTAEKEKIQEHIANIKLAKKQKKRIAELETEQKQLSTVHEELEHALHACEMFTRKKAEMLDDRINNRFKNVRFALTKEQINGGVADTCDVLVPSVDDTLIPFASANNAARINAGLEIIEALGNYWDLSLPVVVDNAESVTQLIEIEPQLIRLVVSDKHPELTME